MIRRFEEPELLPAEDGGRFQWGAALGAGLIPGVILMLVPRGTPWSGISPFISVIMGRTLPSWFDMPLPLVFLTHLAVSEVYGLIIASFVQKLTCGRAVLTGFGVGIVLYLLNLGMVSLVWPSLRGNEGSVLFTHAVFGLIAGASYRGLLRRAAQHG